MYKVMEVLHFEEIGKFWEAEKACLQVLFCAWVLGSICLLVMGYIIYICE